MFLTSRTVICSLVFILITQTIFSQPSGDDCLSPATLTPNTTCTIASGTLYEATVGTPTSSCGTTYDVWYSMTVPLNATSLTIDVAVSGNSLSSSNTYFSIYSGSACSSTLVSGTTCTAAGTSL